MLIRKSVRRAAVMSLVMVVGVGIVDGRDARPAFASGEGGANAAASSQDGPVTVEATGRGESPKEARKEAIVAALRQIVGEYVEADVVIANDEIVKNEILSFSNAGGVKSEQVGEPRVVGDFVEITMRVTVNPQPLVARVNERAKSSAMLDGAALAAEVSIAKGDFLAKKRVFEKAFANLPDSLLSVELFDSQGQPVNGFDRRWVSADPATGGIRVIILVAVAFDQERWRENVRPALATVLAAASRQRIESAAVLVRGANGPAELGMQVSYQCRTEKSLAVPKGQEAVLLLREVLGGGRSFAFDGYVLEPGLLPFVQRRKATALEAANGMSRWELAFPPRTIRVRLRSKDGESIEGADVRLSGDWGQQTNVFMPRSNGAGQAAVPQFLSYIEQLNQFDSPARVNPMYVSPFLALPRAQQGFGAPNVSWSGAVFVAPFWMWTGGGFTGSDNESAPTALSNKFIVPVSIGLDEESLERVAEVTVELVES
jgi:hypothetical protein